MVLVFLSDSCSLNPCKNGGNCSADGIGRYNCTCPLGIGGENCTEGTQINSTLSFSLIYPYLLNLCYSSSGLAVRLAYSGVPLLFHFLSSQFEYPCAFLFVI